VSPPVVIRFLIADAYAVGGTIRATFTTAAALAERGHEVEIVSAYRRRERPALALDPRVRLRALADDMRPARPWERWAADKPSRVIHPDDYRYPRFNGRTDVDLLRFLRSVRDGVLVATRPGLNLALARFGRASVVRVGQDHMNLGGYTPALREATAAHYPQLDAVTALTEETATQYSELLRGRTRVKCIPNAAPAPGPQRARPENKVVIAAGRLNPRKAFDRLLRAWARIAHEWPDWRLDIFGTGPDRDALKRLAADLGISDSAQLRGHSANMPQELATASVFAMTSRREGFPMVLLEAMSVGLPVVSYDCPTGPRDVITDGVDGYIVPDGDTETLGAVLDRLMADEDRRRALGAAAVNKVDRYQLGPITDRWERLFAELSAQKPAARRPRGASARAPA
jgi:glycosyltransferase involved in cell wall biosynthesis